MENGPFGNCKTAELHKIYETQGYGATLVIDKRSQLIVAATENIHLFLGKSTTELVGHPWSLILQPNWIESLFINDANEAVSCIVKQVVINDKPLELSNHTHKHYCYVEFEPRKDLTNTLDFGQRSTFIKKLAATNSAKESASLLMEMVSDIIDFDRVLLYQFLPDWHGEVIDEKVQPGVEGFLGLRFPEGDVPANARRLFTINLQRLIADVNQPSVKIAVLDPSVELDMSFTQLRAIHPVHIKYLQNLGVQASFSLSIVCDGKLWGMLACHHLSPKVISISQRQSCEELTRVAAMRMADLTRGELEKGRFEFRNNIAEIRGALHAQTKGKLAINARINQIKQLFNADGVWHYLDGESFYSGNVPDQHSLTLLKNWLAKLDRHRISVRYQIPQELAKHKPLIRFASGFIYIPLDENEFILVMRQEVIENVLWAGKPQSIDNEEYSVSALTPRSSFQKWSQEVKGQCEPWTNLDVESAEKLREELLDFLDRSNIEYMALRDGLTGLANRLSFERKMESSIRQCIEQDSMFAVFMIDLDNFKPVNDTMGHAAGDNLLIQVSERLLNLVRENDMVARLGGDEFAIILNNLATHDKADLVATRILAEMKRTFYIDGSAVQIGASIGVSLCPLDSVSHEELLREADLALYDVKNAGRDGFKRFDAAMLEGQTQSTNDKAEIQDAFAQQQLAFQYQPIFDASSGCLDSFEVFCVWEHPQKGLLYAKEFKELIETNHLASQWAEWGLEALFKQYQQWQRAGLNVVPMSINLSAKQFINTDIVELCLRFSKHYDVDINWLRIDLDEQTLAGNSRRSEEKIEQLRDLGALVNIDHFGQGLLSLGLLSRIKFNHLKINYERFLFDDPTDELSSQLEILKSISSVLRLPIVATRIADEKTKSIVKSKGIRFLQGNALSPALSTLEATKHLQ